MPRQENAYLIPAAVILGLGIFHCFSAAYMLGKKAILGKQSWTWIISVISLIFIFVLCFAQLLLVDYIASPYTLPANMPQLVQIVIFGLYSLSAIGLTIVFISKLSKYYETKSHVMYVMSLLASFVIAARLTGDGYRIYVSLSVLKGQHTSFEQHQFYSVGESILCIGSALECLFAILGSVSFLVVIRQLNQPKTFLKDVLYLQQGYRFVIVPILYTLVTASTIYSFVNKAVPKFIPKLGFCITLWVYALCLDSISSCTTLVDEYDSHTKSESSKSKHNSLVDIANIFLDRYIDSHIETRESDRKVGVELNAGKIPTYF